MIASGAHTYDGVTKPAGWTPSVTEQQMIMKELSGGSPDAEADIQTLAGACSGRGVWAVSLTLLLRVPPSDHVLYYYPPSL